MGYAVGAFYSMYNNYIVTLMAVGTVYIERLTYSLFNYVDLLVKSSQTYTHGKEAHHLSSFMITPIQWNPLIQPPEMWIPY